MRAICWANLEPTNSDPRPGPSRLNGRTMTISRPCAWYTLVSASTATLLAPYGSDGCNGSLSSTGLRSAGTGPYTALELTTIALASGATQRSDSSTLRAARTLLSSSIGDDSRPPGRARAPRRFTASGPVSPTTRAVASASGRSMAYPPPAGPPRRATGATPRHRFQRYQRPTFGVRGEQKGLRAA